MRPPARADTAGRVPATLVSLVTPTYNQAEFLAQTLDCVLAQTHPALDYRVIDDGSTDATQSVLARYDGRVRYERQANMGQVGTLNRAWEEAGGDYLAYLSSDDLLHPTAIARCVAVLDADPQVVCAFPDADWIDPAGRVIRRAVCRPFDLEDTLVGQRCFIGPGAVFRASAFKAEGGWRSQYRIGPDREFWMRLAAHGRFHFIAEPLAGYRMHPQSYSFREVSEEQSREYIRVLDSYFARPDLSPRLRAREREAYGHAHMLVARNRAAALDWGAARRYAREAARLHPPLGGPRGWAALARAAIGRRARLAQTRLRALTG